MVGIPEGRACHPPRTSVAVGRLLPAPLACSRVAGFFPAPERKKQAASGARTPLVSLPTQVRVPKQLNAAPERRVMPESTASGTPKSTSSFRNGCLILAIPPVHLRTSAPTSTCSADNKRRADHSNQQQGAGLWDVLCRQRYRHVVIRCPSLVEQDGDAVGCRRDI